MAHAARLSTWWLAAVAFGLSAACAPAAPPPAPTSPPAAAPPTAAPAAQATPAATPQVLAAGAAPEQAAASCNGQPRKITLGVSVAPPNVVHTTPYVARALGLFAKRCIDANIIQCEGGQSQTANVAAAQGSAIISVSDVAIGRGMKVQQIWGLAPRMPQAYMVSESVKTAADLKGKRLSATGGGVGGFNWRMGREVLK